MSGAGSPWGRLQPWLPVCEGKAEASVFAGDMGGRNFRLAGTLTERLRKLPVVRDGASPITSAVKVRAPR